MTDIKKTIDDKSTIKEIDKHYSKNFEPRFRLGLSAIGERCKRLVWYTHKKYPAKPPEGRILRLFELGNVIEDIMAADLTACGFTITDTQKRVNFEDGDVELNGSIDGIIKGIVEAPKTPHLWECKSINNKGFSRLLGVGYEAYNEKYKAQVHAYMLGLGLDRAFVTVYNKDTSELYQERIKLKREWIADLIKDTFILMQQTSTPERLCPRRDYYRAKWCDYYKECFKNG